MTDLSTQSAQPGGPSLLETWANENSRHITYVFNDNKKERSINLAAWWGDNGTFMKRMQKVYMNDC